MAICKIFRAKEDPPFLQASHSPSSPPISILELPRRARREELFFFPSFWKLYCFLPRPPSGLRSFAGHCESTLQAFLFSFKPCF